MSNKTLWDSVFVTDPKAVKPISGKSYRGNSPKPYWLIERATDTFGPIGIGWGVIVKSERFERITDTDVLHVAVVSVWYVWDGKRTETFDQMGGTKASYMSKNGMVVDEDAGKKSVTDGMVKCLSMIGFAGDIFTGQWDDSKYVAWAREQYQPKEVPRISAVNGSPDEAPLDDEIKGYLIDGAAYVIDCFKHGRESEARSWIEEQRLDDQQHTFFWQHLDSKTRSALDGQRKKAA